MLNLIMTDEPQVTIVPRRAVFMIRLLLNRRGIPFEVFDESEFQDGWPADCVYRGKYYDDNIYAIVAHITPESLTKAAEDMLHLDRDLIK